ncbi:MAG: adenylate/guanylate cyclase domain-containing protein [Alphaproteobacteria bacterium]|nr:adenylate/guanylate cyclase domain-containing protein [Alphaproteobacteria bacterium]
MRAWTSRLIPVVILLLALFVRVEDPTPVQLVRWWTFDTYQRIEPRHYEPLPVRIVDIDDASLAEIGQWPWPRTRIASLVDRLHEEGAAVVVFDVLFAEPDRTSPRNVLSAWPEGAVDEALRVNVESLPDHDEALAESFARGRVVTGFTLTRAGGATGPPNPKAGVAIGGTPPHIFLPVNRAAISNLPILDKAAAGLGNINFPSEIDGLIRRVPIFTQYVPPGTEPDYADPFALPALYPTLGAEALRVAQGARAYRIKMADGSGEGAGAVSGIASVAVGQVPVVTDGRGHVWLHYTGHRPDRYLPARRLWSADEPITEADGLEGAIVLVGTSAPGLLDLRSTPLNPILPGVEVHAELIEQMLTDSFLTRPDWTLGAELSAFALLGILLILLLPRLGATGGALVSIVAIAAGIAVGWFAYANARILIDPVYPAVVVLLVYMSSSLINFLNSENQRRQIRSAFGQYLSPALVEQLAEEPDRLRLGGETREMTLLFCDIRGFTAISEAHRDDPQGLTTLINRILTPLTSEILDRNGTIDKYMGDCIMAFWNAPLDDADHARHACDAGLAMIEALNRVNEERKAEDPAAFMVGVGVGINSGECVVGNMGSDQRFDYSVLGDAVNLAARLEGQSKNYGALIVVGETTQAHVADEFAFLELDLIAVKGKSEAVTIYALMGDAEMARDPDFMALRESHRKMLTAYRTCDWDVAQDALNACLDCPDAIRELYDLYADRILQYSFDPPPPGWDGVYVAETK